MSFTDCRSLLLRALTVCFLVVLASVVSAPASADVQMPSWALPDGKLPRDGAGIQMPELPSMLPVKIDTVSASLSLPGDFDSVRGVHIIPDTVSFGSPSFLVLDFSDSADLNQLDPDSLTVGTAWLEPIVAPEPEFWDRLLGKQAAEPDLSGLPDHSGQRFVLPVRVYRPDPFIITAGDFSTPVVHVAGLAEGLQNTAEIRQPRVRGWDFWIVGAIAALVTILVLSAIWLWGRRRIAAAIADDWEMPAPAWIFSAVELHALLENGTLAQGDGRSFLDGLAAVIRGFVARRYRIAAREMTGIEIVMACQRLGHKMDQPQNFAHLIDAADCCRYDPDPPDLQWCRTRAATFFKGMRRVRVLPDQTSVEVEQLLRAQKSWSELECLFTGSKSEELQTTEDNLTAANKEVS